MNQNNRTSQTPAPIATCRPHHSLRNTRCAAAVVTLLATLVVSATSAAAAPAWTIVDIGTLVAKPGPLDYSSATAINDAGQVVGMSRNAAGKNRAFLWSAGAGMIDLGDVPGGDDGSIARAINASGQVTGSSLFGSGLQTTHAFRWTTAGGIVDLGAKPNNNFYSDGIGINAEGTVVGWTGTNANTTAFRHTINGGMTLLSKPSGSSTQANAIADDGTIVGFTFKSNGTTLATMWAPNGSRTELPDLPGGRVYSTAIAINATGTVVGASESAAGGRAFVWTAAGGMVDLGDFEGGNSASTAWDLNDVGDIVGVGTIAGNVNRAALWRGGQMIDLSQLAEVKAAGWVLDQATGINNAGQITGLGWHNGELRGWVLSPITTPVPEPATAVLALLGLAGVAARVRRRGDRS